MEHTKEPWAIKAGVIMARVGEGRWHLVTDTDANDRRIVDCVNACADVPRDYLDDLKPGDMMKALEWLYGIRKPIESER